MPRPGPQVPAWLAPILDKESRKGGALLSALYVEPLADEPGYEEPAAGGRLEALPSIASRQGGLSRSESGSPAKSTAVVAPGKISSNTRFCSVATSKNRSGAASWSSAMAW
jgi:hypothetical protein